MGHVWVVIRLLDLDSLCSGRSDQSDWLYQVRQKFLNQVRPGTMAEVNAGGEPPSKKLKFEADALVLPERTIELLRKSLLALEEVPYCFNLIKINNSNAHEDYPFIKTYIKIERSSNKVNADYKTVYSFGSIFMYGVKVLTSFLNDPKKNPTEKEIRIALQRLVQTTLRIEGIDNLFLIQLYYLPEMG